MCRSFVVYALLLGACVLVACDDLGTETRSIAITAPTSPVPAGTSQEWIATATRYDGTTFFITEDAMWSVATPAIASVDRGQVTGLAPGETFVTAEYAGIAATKPLVVSDAVLSSIQIQSAPQLPRGVSQQLIVRGTFSDGGSGDVTTRASWTSSDMAIVEVTSTGIARAIAPGSVTITATIDGIVAMAPLEVTNATIASIELVPGDDMLPKGLDRSYSALGHFTDGSVLDITTSVTWQSSAPHVATVTSSGMVHAKSTGVSTISAQLESGYGKIDLEVTPPLLASLSIAAQPLKVPEGITEQLVAYGRYTDGARIDMTQDVAWSSSDPNVATVSNLAGSIGVVRGVAPGTATLTISAQGLTDTAPLQVSNAKLSTLEIQVGKATIPRFYGEDLVAIGTFNDGSTEDLTTQVTWTSSTGNATVDAAGRTVGVASGPATITATRGMVTDTQAIVVSPATIVSIAITPDMPFVTLGQFGQMTATGTFTDNQQYPLTDDVMWQSNNSAILRMSNVRGSRGRILPYSEGAAIIIADDPSSSEFDNTVATITSP